MTQNAVRAEEQPDEFLAQVREHFSYLVNDFGFELTKVAVPGTFDNRLVQYESPKLRIRIIRDRGSILITMSLSEHIATSLGLPSTWYGVGSILTIIEHPSGPWEYRVDPGKLGDGIPEIARRLGEYIPAILRAFADQNLDEVIRTLDALRTKPFRS